MLLHEPVTEPRVIAIGSPPPPPAQRKGPTGRLRVALAGTFSALGLAIVAASYYMERAGLAVDRTHAVFWAGLATVIFPLALVQLAGGVTRRQRIGLVVLGGLILYAVKVLHDPSLFANSDEFTHLAATRQLSETQQLYEPLPIGGVTVASGFPGLHIATVTLSALTGLSLHTSGLAVIAVARAIFMVAVFLLAERMTRSPRIAGLAALLTAANGNFLFWSSQFSYESLSLPLLLVAIYLATTRNDERRNTIATTLAVVLISVAVIATHHLTSYALAGAFLALSVFSLRSRWRSLRCFDLAVLATAGAAAWFALVGSSTGRYLSYVFERTYTAITDAASKGTRAPFQDASGYQTPIAERALGFAGAAIISLAILWALWSLWRRPQRLATATKLLLTVCGVGFLLLYPIKVFPGAWETVNRSSNFTSVAAAVTIALALANAGTRRRPGRLMIVVVAATITTAVCGAAIQGWPSRVLLSQPIEVRAGQAVLEPEGFAASQWATSTLPAASTYLADEVTGRQLAVDGARFTLSGRADGVREVLSSPAMEPWHRRLLADRRIDFAVVDRRRLSADNVNGYFFQPAAAPDGGSGYYPDAVRENFASLPRSSRVFDSGNIVLYDVRGLRGRPADCRDLPSTTPPNQPACERGGRITLFAAAERPLRLTRAYSLALVDAYVEPRQLETVVDLSVQAVNSGSRRVSLRRGDFELRVGDARLRPRRAAGGRAFLRREGPTRVGSKRFGVLRFRLTGPAERAFARSGAQLLVRRPGDHRIRARYEIDHRGRLR